MGKAWENFEVHVGKYPECLDEVAGGKMSTKEILVNAQEENRAVEKSTS